MTRRSLYRQSARHSSGLYLNDLDEKIVHWKYDVVNSLSPNTGSTGNNGNGSIVATPNANGTNGHSEHGKNHGPFSVKMWIQVDDASYQKVIDCDDSQLLDIKPSKEVPETENRTEDGLSAADIRGAVGGESIPGITAQTYESGGKSEVVELDKPKESEETPKQEQSEAPEEVSAETETKTEEEPKTEQPQDSEEPNTEATGEAEQSATEVKEDVTMEEAP